MPPDREKEKKDVHKYWNRKSCGTTHTQAEKFTQEYFDEIEEYRYRVEPEIFSFAQFSRFHGKKVLEVGIGAGTDFIQWVRSGAEAYGIDLTEEAIDNVNKRLDIYGLHAQHVEHADAEELPFPSDYFDLVYSFGVIHHSPDTQKALSEIVRCVKPGGTGKIMVYNRRSLVTFYLWVKKALLRGRPWKSYSWCLKHFMESPGTKGFTRKEVSSMLQECGISNFIIQTQVTYYDLTNFLPVRLRKTSIGFAASHRIGRILACVCGRDRCGWWHNITFYKNSD